MSYPQQHARVVPHRVGGLGVAAMVLVGIVVVLDIASTWTTWYAYGVVTDYAAGEPGVTEANLYDADAIVSYVAWVYLLAIVVSAIVFVVWLWQARVNAEHLAPARHRRARGWVIGSWICPVVNLWFPFMVVDDVYRASQPTNPPDLFDLRSVPGSRLLGLWWTFWLGSLVLDRTATTTWNNAITDESLRTAGILEVIESAATLVAAVALIQIVRQISSWQDNRAA